MLSPLVSVIVPTFNRPDQLGECLRSIVLQTYPEIEIIVVNDAGTDIENVVDRFKGKNRIVHIRHPENRGLPAARNTGIRKAGGKYIAYLDDDDRFYPEHIETLVNFLEAGDYRVAYTDAARAHMRTVRGNLVVMKRNVPHSLDFDPEHILVRNYIPVLCVMHEKSCLDESGLFDESLGVLEDWDLWIRMSRKFEFAHIRKTTCEVAWREDGQTMSSGRLSDFWRTVERIYAKYAPYAQDRPHVRKAQRNYLRGAIFLARMSRLLGERSALFQFLLNTLTAVYNRRSPLV